MVRVTDGLSLASSAYRRPEAIKKQQFMNISTKLMHVHIMGASRQVLSAKN
jgi:hypothetical protein